MYSVLVASLSPVSVLHEDTSVLPTTGPHVLAMPWGWMSMGGVSCQNQESFRVLLTRDPLVATQSGGTSRDLDERAGG